MKGIELKVMFYIKNDYVDFVLLLMLIFKDRFWIRKWFMFEEEVEIFELY